MLLISFFFLLSSSYRHIFFIYDYLNAVDDNTAVKVCVNFVAYLCSLKKWCDVTLLYRPLLNFRITLPKICHVSIYIPLHGYIFFYSCFLSFYTCIDIELQFWQFVKKKYSKKHTTTFKCHHNCHYKNKWAVDVYTAIYHQIIIY